MTGMLQSAFGPRRSRASCRILVMGASGELGGALARFYARRGCGLVLWGRDRVRLDRIAGVCRELGAANVAVQSLDLTDLAAAKTALEQADEAAPFDLAIFASGLGDVRAPGDRIESADLVEQLGRVNFLAPSTLAAQLAERMTGRERGTIVLVGSAAGFHSLPFAAAYAATKSGLARFADALRIAAAPHGVTVTHVSPGFIDTAAARRVPGPKPFVLSVDQAARRIAEAADLGKAHVVMPWPFGLLRMIAALLPRALSDRLLRSLAPPLPPAV